LVIGNSAVSAHHATVMMDRMMVQDDGSTSGTYVGGQRIPPNQPVPLDPNGVVAFGPVPVPVSLLGQLAQAFAGAGGPMAAPMGAPLGAAMGGARGGRLRAHRTKAHRQVPGPAHPAAHPAAGENTARSSAS